MTNESGNPEKDGRVLSQTATEWPTPNVPNGGRTSVTASAALIVVLVVMLGVWLFGQPGQSQRPVTTESMSKNAKFAEPSGFIPETITVKRTMDDQALLCLEPPYGGLVQCRTIGQLRKWMMEGAKK